MKRVVVGLSGGVDSSVAAHLLMEQGYEVIGIFMKNWHDDTVTISDECPWEEDSNDALLVADKLGIPFQTIDFSEAYKERIVNYMFKEYEAGRTPNPDVLCNREIKFDVFLKAALELNADYVATGHYCQKKEHINEKGETVYSLIAGADNNKDQSYFLCQLTQKQLAKALFPIGHLEKPEVRKIAEAQDLVTANKKDSQGLCFIGKVKLPEFLQQQLAPKEGNIVIIDKEHPMYSDEFYQMSNPAIDSKLEAMVKPYIYTEADGKVVGKHQGAHYFTIGQRKGLGVGGFAEPLFIIGTDTTSNTVYVGMGDEHPGLNRKGLKILEKDVHWTREDLKLEEGNSIDYKFRIRYRQTLVDGTLYNRKGNLYIIFNELMKGITPGQFAAWYKDGESIGSGVING